MQFQTDCHDDVLERLILGRTCMRGTQKTPEFIYKTCVFILTCLNFSHLQSTLYLMQYTYQNVSPLLRTVFELVDFDAF